jgi:hypothetical protein
MAGFNQHAASEELRDQTADILLDLRARRGRRSRKIAKGTNPGAKGLVIRRL